MNVADYTLKFLSDRGVRSIFMVTGGQAMFLNDAVYRAKKIEPIFCHHEQAVGMAAEAYARTKGTIGVAMVTAGPGAVNVLNGWPLKTVRVLYGSRFPWIYKEWKFRRIYSHHLKYLKVI
ncbi:hypothetical protein HY024_04175 [Candidatus Curtissbacteria bacterium]|nr:hypothetical protein [Candidatus Curtissbacteria bacterium]